MNRLLRMILFYGICYLGIHFIRIQALDPAINQLYAETIAMIIISLATLFATHFDKKKITLINSKKLTYHIGYGFRLSILWIVPIFILLYLTSTIAFDYTQWTIMLPIWILACLFHVISQELLVRGYVFQLVKQVEPIFALVFSAIVFVIINHPANAISMINCILMSVFLSLIVLDQKSLTPAIVIHFIWDLVCGILFNGMTIENYPQMVILTFQGNELLSGGNIHMTASIIVTLLNLLIMSYFLFVKKPKLS